MKSTGTGHHGIERPYRMKRTIVVACALLGVLGAPYAQADEDDFLGSVDAAVTHPAIPRAMYLQSERLNGVTGYVIPLEAEPRARTFRLELIEGATGQDDLDAWFYRDIFGTGDPCPRIIHSHSAALETGEACEDAAFAVVVLFSGADAAFELTLF